MSRVLFIFLFPLVIIFVTADDSETVTSTTSTSYEVTDSNKVKLKCGPNEEQNDCPNECDNDYCPKSEADAKRVCVASKTCLPPKCVCMCNTRRAENDSCIDVGSCPPFDCSHQPHQEYVAFPPFCSDSCEFATADGNCHIVGRIGIPIQYKPTCRCIKHYWRKDGICISYAQCKTNQSGNLEDMPKVIVRPPIGKPIGLPVTMPIPVESEEKSTPDKGKEECPKDCPSDYCPKNEKESKIQSCNVPKNCTTPKSKCGFNMRAADNGTCVSVYNCPPFKCSGKNEEFVPCASYCPGESCESATPDGNCPAIFGILPVVNCSPSCHCIKNFWRKNGTCVPYSECGKGKLLVTGGSDCPTAGQTH